MKKYVVSKLSGVMRSDIVARQRAKMQADGIDAMVSCSPENFAYVTGFVVPSHPIMRWRHAMAIVTAKGETTLFAVDMEESTVRAKAPGTDLAIWREFEDDPMEVLAQRLTELGLAKAVVGIEMDYISAAHFSALGRFLSDCTFVPIEAMLARMRQIKTAEEIALLRRLSRISDKAIHDAYGAVQAGSSEMDIASALTRGIYTQGAEQFELMIVATGDRSRLPNVLPSGRKLEPKDICRVEIFSKINGYHAGVCRTARVREAPDQAERIWAHLVECKYRIMEMVKPQASSRAIYESFIKKLRELNLPPIAFVGHGIGLHLHEEPYLGKYSDSSLEAGMVLGFEPLCYETGYGFGMQLKDMLLVTEDACELLSDYTNTDELIRIS